jgi:hypothetical protein
MKRMLLALVALGTFACGDDGASTPVDGAPAGDASVGVDGAVAVDAAVDAPNQTPITLTISGVAEELSITGRTPLANVTIEAYARGSATLLGTTTTNVQGAFSITVTSNGPLDGYLKGRINGRLDTYLYPPAPLESSLSNLAVLMVTQGILDAATTLAGANQSPENGLVGVMVLNASSQPVAGATVSSTPAGQVRYNANNLPSSSATSTSSDGIAYIFDLPPGDVTVSATGGGLTFPSHSVEVRAGVVTTTLIHP